MSSRTRVSTLLLGLSMSAHAYVWPNPMLDTIEGYIYDQQGYNNGPFIGAGITPCSLFTFGTTANRSNAADWIRTVCGSFYIRRLYVLLTVF